MIIIFLMNYFCLVFIFILFFFNDFYYNILIFWIDSIGGSIIVVCVGFCWIVRRFGIFCGVMFGRWVNNFCFYIRFGGIVVFYK